ncbi:MAG: DUF5680 domain-containing protein [Patescibacteria group bacterium]
MKIEKDKLLKFIQSAKDQSWATNQNQAQSPIPGTKLHTFQDGDFFYYDIYGGFTAFSGTEMVLLRQEPVWFMSYHGQILGRALPRFDSYEDLKHFQNQIHDFLHRVLRRQDVNDRFRGPPSVYEKPWEYECEQNGNWMEFNGEERIYYDNDLICRCTFQGQIVL